MQEKNTYLDMFYTYIIIYVYVNNIYRVLYIIILIHSCINRKSKGYLISKVFIINAKQARFYFACQKSYL